MAAPVYVLEGAWEKTLEAPQVCLTFSHTRILYSVPDPGMVKHSQYLNGWNRHTINHNNPTTTSKQSIARKARSYRKRK